MAEQDFNLLATTFRGAEHEASSELFALLKSLGDEAPSVYATKVSGLIACHTTLQPSAVVQAIREKVQSEPWSVRYLLRLIPIERVVKTDLESIRLAAEELAGKIGENESFRITIDKRFTSLRSQEIISAVAKNIHRRVDLENPDWVVMIQVVGGRTGASILRPDEILSVSKEKRGVVS
jgi:tRNA acetyltransferase TAN1